MRIFVERQNPDSPFVQVDGVAYLARHGIAAVPSILWADLVITCSVARANQLWRRYPWKRFFVWTNEPHYDYTLSDERFSHILVRNVYSGRVFFHNRHFLQTYYAIRDSAWRPNAESTAEAYDPRRFSFDDRPAHKALCFVFTRRPERDACPVTDGAGLNLEPVRQRLAEESHAAGCGHIYGGNWPADMAIADSRNSPCWWLDKIEILQRYYFIAAIENAAFPYYCTEKIWHAIIAGGLPVYWARGTAIHETFPDDSFLDASRFGTTQELLECIAAMEAGEFCRRFNRCAEVFAREQARRRDELAAEDRVEFRELVADLLAWTG